ncbi:helix-turn-helix transcriptional regulator [Streptomyces dysideae]|uniref:LuxR family transcriptional regulator n=1 Tax=Streptomyces dysideae TaxID=909626 RepID=A0A124IE16_9ACTN|nr:helix-turn-helix transcriptional regulator [Streptomyces dysideae]KUO16867.1 LuxR family transcriptional regulator [Streptomyces dysideae]
MPPAGHPEHSAEDLCPEGAVLYERALREGHLRAEDAGGAPCLIDFGLLHPSVADLSRLEPVAPAVALHRLLRASEDRIADERRRELRLAETFAGLMWIDGRHTAATDTPVISVLSGFGRVNQAIAEAMADASRELLAIQPYNGRTAARLNAETLERDQALLDRGGRIRTLYQHTQRHSLATVAHYEQLNGDAEARTLDQVTERLLVIDGTVAFIPASKDRTVALEVRHPALVDYFATTFDRFWHMATPMYPEAVQRPSHNGITPRQQAIAALLIEGHTDAVIADRLGMNIRTAREHIAKLAATLGSESRAQLGYLIGQSGILDQGR